MADILLLLLAAWFGAGFIGALIWLWAEWDFRNFGYAPLWWQILWPTLLGPMGLAVGITLAVSKLRHG